MCTIKHHSFGSPLDPPLYIAVPPTRCMYWKVRLKVSERQTWVHLHVTYRFRSCVGPLRPVVTHTCRWSNTVSNKALINRSLLPGGCKAETSRMGRLKRDIYISPTPSVVSICGKVPTQKAPNGLPCAVLDARVYGSGRL